MNILVISPHPDDEIIGCGGIISKYNVYGNKIDVCMMTSAYSPDWSGKEILQKKDEKETIKTIANYKNLYELDFPTVKLDTIPRKKIIDELTSVIDESKPDIVYLPFGYDSHIDHRITFESSLISCRCSCSNVKEIRCYETLTEFKFQPFVPNVYEDITEYIDKKMMLMGIYKSEVKEPPHIRSIKTIKDMGSMRGNECSMEYAEAFVLIRGIYGEDFYSQF